MDEIISCLYYDAFYQFLLYSLRKWKQQRSTTNTSFLFSSFLEQEITTPIPFIQRYVFYSLYIVSIWIFEIVFWREFNWTPFITCPLLYPYLIQSPFFKTYYYEPVSSLFQIYFFKGMSKLVNETNLYFLQMKTHIKSYHFTHLYLQYSNIKEILNKFYIQPVNEITKHLIKKEMEKENIDHLDLITICNKLLVLYTTSTTINYEKVIFLFHQFKSIISKWILYTCLSLFLCNQQVYLWIVRTIIYLLINLIERNTKGPLYECILFIQKCRNHSEEEEQEEKRFIYNLYLILIEEIIGILMWKFCSFSFPFLILLWLYPPFRFYQNMILYFVQQIETSKLQGYSSQGIIVYCLAVSGIWCHFNWNHCLSLFLLHLLFIIGWKEMKCTLPSFKFPFL